MPFTKSLALALSCLALTSAPLFAQIVEVPAMTLPNVTIDMDNVGPVGPTTLAAINAAAQPTPANIVAITLTPNTSPGGIYNTNPQGRALGIDPTGAMILVDPPSGVFDGFGASIDLGCPSTEFGCSIGDWASTMVFTCLLSGNPIGTVTISYSGGGLRYLQSTAGPFDRVDFQTTSGAGNWVIPDLVIEVCGGPTAPEYQINSSEASLTINAASGTTSTPATVTLPVGSPTLMQLTSVNLGMPWELGYGIAPLVPLSAGGVGTADGQVINLDLTDPTFSTLWNLFQSPGFVNAALPFSVAGQVSVSTQMLIAAPAMATGLAISQPTRLIVQ